jgi:hypothetical protein
MEFNTMALVSCPECQKEVSTHALACPQCAFPFPGQQDRSVVQAGTTPHACPDCGNQVSKQAKACPHCGIALTLITGEQGALAVNGHAVEETWLCTQCGTPYTRKVPKAKGLGPSHQAVPRSPRRRPQQLWQEPSLSIKPEKEVIVPRYRRSRKKPFIVGFIILVLLVASIGVGAFWKFQGLNPLEALVYWRM